MSIPRFVSVQLALAVALALALAVVFGVMLADIAAAGDVTPDGPAIPPTLQANIGYIYPSPVPGTDTLFNLHASANNLGGLATGVVMTVTYPAELQFDNPPADGDCIYTAAQHAVVCRKAALQSFLDSITFGANHSLYATRPGSFPVTVTVTADQPDDNPNDNVATGVVDVLSDAVGSIQGIVYNESDQPLAGVAVYLFRKYDDGAGGIFWDNVAVQATDAWGGYQHAQLQPGTYQVQFVDSSAQYVSEWYANAATPETAEEIELADPYVYREANAWLHRVDATPTPGILQGNLLNDAYQPLAGMRVTLYDANMADVGTPPWREVMSTTTGADGTFQMTGIMTGTYYVRFSDPALNYRQLYYDGTEYWEQARQLPFEWNVTRSVSALLFPNPPGRLQGTVFGDRCRPAQAIQVTALHSETGAADAAWTPVVTGTTNDVGAYVLENLPTGFYRVRFDDPAGQYSSIYAHGAATLADAETFVVTPGSQGGDIDEVMARKTGGTGGNQDTGAITGTVTDQEKETLAGVLVTALRQAGDGSAGATWNAVATATTDDNGSFTLAGLAAGAYRLKFSDLRDQYQTEYYADAPDVERALSVAVTQNTTVTADAALDLLPLGIIYGRVVDDQQRPLYNYRVTAYRGTGVGGTNPGWTAFLTTVTDGQGAYQVHLPPGVYRLAFADPEGKRPPLFYPGAAAIDAADDINVAHGTVRGLDDAAMDAGGDVVTSAHIYLPAVVR